MDDQISQSVKFLRGIFQSCEKGEINIRFLPSKKNYFIPLSKIDSIHDLLTPDQNCYFGVATRINNDGTKNGVCQVPAVWCDIDFKNGLTSDGWFEQVYKNFPLRASLGVRTGGGIHLYWLLKEPAGRDEIGQIESVLRRIAIALKGDIAACEVARIMRIPGTRNLKYSPPCPVRLVGFHLDRQYSLDDFDILPPDEEPVKEPTPKGWEDELLDGVEEGRRNDSLTRLAGRYVAKGLSEREILPVLIDANSRFKPPLDRGEVENVLNSVMKTHQRNHPVKDGGYRLTTLADIFGYPEPEYIIDPILIKGTVNVLGAYTGVGKSILTLTILKSILTGNPLWGKFPVKETGPILLIDEETPQGFLRDRTQKIGFDRTLPFYCLHFQGVQLDKDESFYEFVKILERVNPILVAIDSLIRVHRQKEDDSTQMARVIDRLRKIANWGTTVLVIHHHRKGEGPLSQKLRGSSDIPGGVDIEYALIPKDGYLAFSSVKTRTRPLEPIKLKLEVAETEIGLMYVGTEEEATVNEMVEVLKGKGRLGVDEIFQELQKRQCDIGINRLRDILKKMVGREIKGEQETGRGKRWVYWVDDSSRFTPIYRTVKSEETSENTTTLHGINHKRESPREETSQYFQEDSDSSRVKNEGNREELKDIRYEVLPDGQITY